MAKIRCSNCEKSVKKRFPDGEILNSQHCKATGKFISSGPRGGNPDDPYYKARKCDEFLPRIEYSQQFQTAIDKIRKGLAVGKEIKDLIK